MAIREMGVDQFGLYSLIAVVTSVVSLASLGTNELIALKIAGFLGEGSPEKARDFLRSGLLATLMLVLPLLTLTLAFVWLVSPGVWLGEGVVIAEDAFRRDCTIALLASALSVLLASFNSAQEGHQEYYITNVMALVSSLITAGSLAALVYRTDLSITGLIVAQICLPVLVQFINAIYFLWRHPAMKPALLGVSSGQVLEVYKDGMSFFTVTKIVPMLRQQGVKLIITNVLGVSAVGVVAAYAVLEAIVASGFSAFVRPLLAAISDGRVKGDYEWIAKVFVRSRFVVFTAIVLIVLLFLFRGNWFSRIWLGVTGEYSVLFFGFVGLSFGCMLWSSFHFIVLASLGRVAGVARVKICEAGVYVFLLLSGLSSGGLMWIYASRVIAFFATSGWWFMREVKQSGLLCFKERSILK